MEQDTHKDIWDMLTTKTRMLMRHIQRSDGTLVEIERRMREITVPADRRKDKGRGVWNAIWTGLGVIKAEGDKLFKE
jgi:hypothetical protein